MESIRRLDLTAIGNNVAIALARTRDFLFYLECLAVLRTWNAPRAERLLLHAVEISGKGGLNDAREFLLGHLSALQRERLERAYGIDLQGFRFRSPYAPGARERDWFLD